MLILTRDVGQKIIINGGEIEITVLGTSKGKVKLGVNAKPDIPVDREEVYLSKLEKKQNPA